MSPDDIKGPRSSSCLQTSTSTSTSQSSPLHRTLLCHLPPCRSVDPPVPAMSPLPLVLLSLLAGVSPIRVMSGTTADLYDYDEPLSRSVEADAAPEKDEDGNDIPPEPKHHGYHMMPKLAKDAVGK